MGCSRLLSEPWPPDLDPVMVAFKTRSETVLRRMGYFDDPSLFDTLTEAEVMSWWNAGVRTVEDIRNTGNEAIRRHHDEATEHAQLKADLASVAEEPWAKHIWHRDPRFAALLPKGDATVYDIATTGTLADQRVLWGNLNALRGAVAVQASLSLPRAVAQYVEAISGQHGERLEVLLARTGLNGQDPITGREAARRLNRSDARIQQIRDSLLRHRDRCRLPEGVWMPQVGAAERDGWPEGYTAGGVEATRAFWRLGAPSADQTGRRSQSEPDVAV